MAKRFAIALVSAFLILGGASMAQKLSGNAGYSGAKGSASVDHQVRVHIPNVVILRLNGTGSNYAVDFKPTATQMANAATGTATSVSPDSSSGFVSLEGFTNSGSDVPITIKVTDPVGSTASAAVLSDIMIGSGYLSNAAKSPVSLTILGTGSTSTRGPAWTTLIDDSSSSPTNPFSLALQGTEAPGDYSFVITYSATTP